MKTLIVSATTEVILDNEKYLLEEGDHVNIFSADKDTDKIIMCKREKKPTKHFYSGVTKTDNGDKHYWTCKSCYSTFIHDFGPDA